MAPVTLEQAKNFVQEDYDPFVIDSFRAASPLLNLLQFDTAVNPAGGGATLTYGYHRLLAPSTADFRAINTEYKDDVATTERKSVDLTVLGGSFKVDRVIAGNGSVRANEVAFQMQQKIKAATLKFTDGVINGDAGVDANGFDGLSKALTGTSQEVTDTVDWSGVGEDAAFNVLDGVDQLTGLLDGDATVLIGNSLIINKLRSAARRVGAYTTNPTGLLNANGDKQFVERVGNAIIIDAGNKPGSGESVIGSKDGSTSLYAVRLGLDGFHGVTTTNNQGLVKTWLPDFTTAGAVKRGEVELGPVAVALKNAKAAAVLRDIKLKPSATAPKPKPKPAAGTES